MSYTSPEHSAKNALLISILACFFVLEVQPNLVVLLCRLKPCKIAPMQNAREENQELFCLLKKLRHAPKRLVAFSVEASDVEETRRKISAHKLSTAQRLLVFNPHKKKATVHRSVLCISFRADAQAGRHLALPSWITLLPC